MRPLLAVVLLSLPALAADPASTVAVVNAACGPDNVKFNVKSSRGSQPAPQPEPGKALVFVVEQYDRPANEFGKPTIRVGLDGAWVGANRSTSHLFFSVEPGELHLCSNWQSLPPWLRVQASLASLTAEPGQTYYFRTRVIEHDRSVFTLDLEPINSDEGQMLVATSPLSDYRQKK